MNAGEATERPTQFSSPGKWTLAFGRAFTALEQLAFRPFQAVAQFLGLRPFLAHSLHAHSRDYQ